MNPPPFGPGAWVWCNFPTSENPIQPGPSPHATYVIAVTGVAGVGQVALVAYTTSQVRDPPRPQGIIHFDAEKAAKMGHNKPFLLNPGRMAPLPINSAYFPFLNQPNHGVIGTASKSVQDAIARVAAEIRTKRPEAVEVVGPPLRPKPR